jgi:hypothetical protein
VACLRQTLGGRSGKPLIPRPMLENIGKATNKNPLIYASPKFFGYFSSKK